MQYTIRQIPKAVDKMLRAKAKREKKSLNQIVVEALARSAGINNEPGKPKRDLSFFSMDEESAKAIEAAHRWHDQIDPEKWR